MKKPSESLVPAENRRINPNRNATVEPLNKGDYGANSFVPCREVVPISEGPLLEVPLYLFASTLSTRDRPSRLHCTYSKAREQTVMTQL